MLTNTNASAFQCPTVDTQTTIMIKKDFLSFYEAGSQNGLKSIMLLLQSLMRNFRRTPPAQQESL